MIECKEHDDILYLCGMINSKLMIYFIKQKYSSSSYNGGINFSKEMINSLPWSLTRKETVVGLVKQIMSMDPDDDVSKIKEVDEAINFAVYEMFALTPEEISVIESAV